MIAERMWVMTIVVFIFSSIVIFTMASSCASTLGSMIEVDATVIAVEEVQESRFLASAETRFVLVSQYENDGELFVFHSSRLRNNPIHVYPIGSLVQVRFSPSSPNFNVTTIIKVA